MSTFKLYTQQLNKAFANFDTFQNNDLINIAFILKDKELVLQRSDVTQRIVLAYSIPIEAIHVIPATYILNYKEFKAKTQSLSLIECVTDNVLDTYIEMCSQKITLCKKDEDSSAAVIYDIASVDEEQLLTITHELRSLLNEVRSFMRVKTDTNVYSIIDNCINLQSYHGYLAVEACNGKEMLHFISEFKLKYSFILDNALLSFLMLRTQRDNVNYNFTLYKHAINNPDSLFSNYYVYGIKCGNVNFYVLRQQGTYANYKELLAVYSKPALKFSYSTLQEVLDKTPCKVHDTDIAEVFGGVYNIKALQKALYFFEEFEPEIKEISLWCSDKLLTLRTKYGVYFLKNIKGEW